MEDSTPNVIVVESKKRINWLAAALVAVIIMILFGWCRGYRNSIKAEDDMRFIKTANDSLQKVNARKDKELLQLRKDTAGTNELVRDLFLTQEQIEDTLHKVEGRASKLAMRILKDAPAWVTLPPDSAVHTFDPCVELAKETLKQQSINRALESVNDSIQAEMQVQIQQRDKLANHWKGRADTCQLMFNTLLVAAKSIKPNVNFKIGGKLMYNEYIRGGGPLLMMEDRKGNVYITNMHFTNHGKLYEVGYAKTISLRRKR